MKQYISHCPILLLWMFVTILLSTACGAPPSVSATGGTVTGQTPPTGAPPSGGAVTGQTPPTGAPPSGGAVTSQTPPTGAPSSAGAVNGGTPKSPPAETKIVFGPGTFALADPREGLAALASYRATLTIAFDGIESGQAKKWTSTFVMLYTSERPARQLTITTTENNAAPITLFKAEMDGAAYEWSGADTCSAAVADPMNPLAERQEPAGALKAVLGADEAGQETVNGIAAKHYTFDERALLENGLNKSSGEIWVAAEGGYIVRYRVTTKGTADYFGKGVDGTLSRAYELTEANKPVTITLPKDCPPGLVNAPLMPNATNMLKLPGMLRYDTTSSVAEAAAYYQPQLAALGWASQGDPDIRDTKAFLDFVKGDQALTVLITTHDRVRQVQIILVNSKP